MEIFLFNEKRNWREGGEGGGKREGGSRGVKTGR